jgi:hypothetical protein
MPSFFPPVTSSGSRSPAKPRPLPRHVKYMIQLMVGGREDDLDQRPLDFIEAGKVAGIAPDRARRWLDRAETRAFLRTERRAFHDAICAGNEAHLARIRGGPNAAAAVRAISVLEELDDAEMHPARGAVSSPGLAIVIVDGRAPRPSATMVDVTPTREPDDARD